MLVAVVVLFAICWGPILIDNVLTAYGYLPRIKGGTHKHLNTAFQLMAYFNRYEGSTLKLHSWESLILKPTYDGLSFHAIARLAEAAASRGSFASTYYQ